ncbi:MAG: type II secretion system protein GspN [Desulfotignum sp.]|nr:type II secretion system protein GspN [Desulfobacteraceae bacterium]
MTVKRFFIYLVYFTGAIAVFTVMRFPHQEAARKISLAAENMFPGIRITMDRASLCLPPGVTIKDTFIHLGDTLTLAPDDFQLYFPVSSILGLKNDMHFSTSLLEGNVSGHIMDISLKENTYSGLQIAMTGLKIKDKTLAMQGMTAQLSFGLSGTYHVPEGQTNPAGKGELLLSRGTCAIRDDFLNTMGITNLDFTKITLAFGRDKNKIIISELLASGDIIKATARGEMTFTGGNPTDPENWIVALTGSLHPQPAYVSKFAGILSMENLFKTNPEKGIPFTITGRAATLEMKL